MSDAYRITELERRLDNIIRMGVIFEVDLGKARVRVKDGEITTGWLRWLTSRANGDEVTWHAPEVGERVVVLSLSGELTQGFVLPAFYCDDNPAPSDNADEIIRQHADGARDDYDRASHTRIIELPDIGSLIIRIGTTEITVRDGEVEIDAATVLLGPPGNRKAVARKGDKVNILTGSSAGLNGVIDEGSAVVSAS